MSSFERRTRSIDVGEPPEGFPVWETFTVHINDYERYSSSSCIQEGTITFFRYPWTFRLYPKGCNPSTNIRGEIGDRSVLVCLTLDAFDYSERDDVEGEIKVIDRDGGVAEKVVFTTQCVQDEGKVKVEARLKLTTAAILDPSNNTLRDGTLTIEISMRQLRAGSSSSMASFVPPNPIKQSILGMFLDEETADVLLKVGDREFHAHSFMLQACAPDLAELSLDYEKLTPVPISNVDPDVFHQLLFYVYGGEICRNYLVDHATEIIEAADRYGVPNLKLLVESSYILGHPVTVSNAIENLHFAESKNLALLKETVMHFLVENASEVLEKTSLKTAPESGILTSVLAAVAEKKNWRGGEHSQDIKAKNVSCLRRLLHEKGQCVDGSRETLIAALEKHSESKGTKKRKRRSAAPH